MRVVWQRWTPISWRPVFHLSIHRQDTPWWTGNQCLNNPASRDIRATQLPHQDSIEMPTSYSWITGKLWKILLKLSQNVAFATVIQDLNLRPCTETAKEGPCRFSWETATLQVMSSGSPNCCNSPHVLIARTKTRWTSRLKRIDFEVKC